jgi:hypothetical protein
MRVARAIGIAAALVVSAAVLPASATTHVTKPQVRDAAGDWKVTSQDIIDATFTATTKQIRGDLHLGAPPATGVPALYDVVVIVGCTPYSLHFTWTGAPQGSAASLDRYACSTGDAIGDGVAGLRPVASTPATATLTSTGLRIVAAPTGALRRGAQAFAMAETRLTPVIVGSSLSWNDPSYGGDIAIGDNYFVLGP